jgi:biotin synthase-related radical SAM superfamily protein
MSPLQKEKHTKRKEKSKAKKKKLFEAKLLHFKECCHGNIVEWGCYCSYGCDACHITKACSECNRPYCDDTLKNYEKTLTQNEK